MVAYYQTDIPGPFQCIPEHTLEAVPNLQFPNVEKWINAQYAQIES